MKANLANQGISSSDLAALASYLILQSSLINNLNTATIRLDNIYVIAATIGLLSNYLSKAAALKEASEQQIVPGVTTFANELKIISSTIGLIAGILSYWALLMEVSLRAQGIQAPQMPNAGGNTSVTGALLVQ